MGAIASASCKCGFCDDNMYLGGGMEDWRTMCRFPFFCRDCESLVLLNALNKARYCTNCHGTDLVPYDDKSMSEDGEKRVFEASTMNELGRDLALTDGLYLCPACGKKALRFEHRGCWD